MNFVAVLRPARVGCLRGLAVVCHRLLFPALPRSILQHTGAGAARQHSQHRQQAPATSPGSKDTPETTRGSVAAVARAVPGVAGGSRGARCRAAVLAETNASAAPPLPPVPRVLEGAGRCGLRRGYLALPRRCALRPLSDLRSNCRSVAVGWQGRSGVLRNAVGFAAKPIFRVPTTRLQGETIINTAESAGIDPCAPSQCQDAPPTARKGLP
jgi:hypothetical protein